jgi:hypothetical protein
MELQQLHGADGGLSLAWGARGPEFKSRQPDQNSVGKFFYCSVSSFLDLRYFRRPCENRAARAPRNVRLQPADIRAYLLITQNDEWLLADHARAGHPAGRNRRQNAQQHRARKHPRVPRRRSLAKYYREQQCGERAAHQAATGTRQRAQPGKLGQ